MLTPEQQQRIDEQIALSKSLGLGFALSLLPTAGLGSIAAIVIGARAQKKINSSDHELAGRGMALWCIVVGIFGLIASICWIGLAIRTP